VRSEKKGKEKKRNEGEGRRKGKEEGKRQWFWWGFRWGMRRKKGTLGPRHGLIFVRNAASNEGANYIDVWAINLVLSLF
jgi:hypothetical protein